MMGNLNEREVAYVSVIKRKETSIIYKHFIKMDEIFVLKKLRKKFTPHDTEK